MQLILFLAPLKQPVYVVLALNLVVVELFHILLQFFYFEPHGQVVVPLLLPDVLLLEVYYLVLHLARRRIQHLYRVVYLRHSVNVEVVFLLGDHVAYLLVVSAQDLHNRAVDAQHLARKLRVINALIGPLLSLQNHVWSHDASLSNLIEGAVLIIAVGKDNVNNARQQYENFRAFLTYFEESLSWLEEPLLRPVEELPKDVLISIPQEFDIVLSQFHKFFAL